MTTRATTGKPMAPAARRGGFTLLEMVLALSVTAMLALTLYMSLVVGLRARDSAVAAVAPIRAATVAADLAVQDLESVLPPAPTVDEDGALIETLAMAGPFVGVRGGSGTADADSLSVITLGRDDTGPEAGGPLGDGPRRVWIGVRTDLPTPTLVRRVQRILHPRSAETYEEEILCRDVRQLLFEYFDGWTWRDQWDSQESGDVLPYAVRMTLVINYVRSPGAEPRPVKIVRVVPLACAKPLEDPGEQGGFFLP